MATQQVDTKTEYIPPRKFWKYFLLYGVNALTAWIILYFGNQCPVLWFRIFCLLLGAFLALVSVVGLYTTIFYKPPYKLNVSGIFIQGTGLVPWSAIERDIYIDSIGYRGFVSRSVRFELRDLSFLKKADMSRMKKRWIEKKRYVFIAADGLEEISIISVWVATYCRNMKNTKDIEISIWGKKERERSPIYVSHPRKNRYDTVRYTVCGIPVIDPDSKLDEEPIEWVPQMNAVIEQIVDVLAREDYDALRPIFFDHTRVEPDTIRREIEKAKAEGWFAGISTYNQNARAKIVATSAKYYHYFYELTAPCSKHSLSLRILFRIGRDSGKLQALWPGKLMIMPCASFPSKEIL